MTPSFLKSCGHLIFLSTLTVNKVSRGDGIPAELFQVLKDHDFVAIPLPRWMPRDRAKFTLKEGYYEPSIHCFLMKKSYIKNINENTTLIQYAISRLAYVIF